MEHRLQEAFRDLSSGKLNEARVVFETLSDRDSNRAQAFHGLALVALHDGKFGKAKSYIGEALFLEPLSSEFYCCLASIFQNLKDNGRALKCLGAAIALSPGSEAVRSDLILLLKATGQFEEVQKLITSKHDVAKEEEKLKQALLLKQKNNILEAEEILRILIYSRANFVFARAELAGIYQNTGRLVQFIEQLRAIISFIPNYVQAHTILGDNLRTLYQLKSINRNARKKLGLKNDDHEDLAMLLEARNAYGQAIDLRSQHLGAMIGLARLESQEGKEKIAIEWLKRVMNVEPTLHSIRSELSRLLRQCGEFTEARNVMEEISNDILFGRSCHIEQAYASLENGDTDKALDWFHKALLYVGE